MTSVGPANQAELQMAQGPDLATDPPAQAATSAAEAEPARPRLRDQIAENPLLSLFSGIIVVILTVFGTAFVALLIFSLTSIHNGIDSLEARLDRLEVKVDAGFAAQGAQIAELDARLTAQIAELDARLTAQIAELDARLTAQIAELDARLTAQIAELERKLTGLIAHLNATEAVEAALEHRLLVPDASVPEPGGESPG